MTDITQKELKRLFDYDPETGVFIRIVRTSNRVRVGDIAGYSHVEKCGKTYWRNSIYGTNYKTHRLVWLYVHGKFPSDQIDHINGNGLDNRIVNLRVVTHGENQKNARLRVDNTSGTSGVCWHKRKSKWTAMIRADGKRKNLGYFTQLDDAVDARKQAERQYGFHENHGTSRPL